MGNRKLAGLIAAVALAGAAIPTAAGGSDRAVRVDSDGVWMVRGSGSVEQIFRVTHKGSLGRVEPSPSGRLLLVRHSEEEGSAHRLKVIEVATGRVLRPLGDGENSLAGLGWSGDGHLVIAELNSRRLDRVDVRTGMRRTIWEGDDVVQSLAVSPDGKQVVFRRECPCDTKVAGRHSLWVVGSDGTKPRQLLAPLHYLDNKDGMVFAGDSRRVAVLAGGRRSIVDLVSGTETVLARSPQYHPDEPHRGFLGAYRFDRILGWSPTSDWVAFDYESTDAYRADGNSAISGSYRGAVAFGPRQQVAHLTGSQSGELRVSTLPDRNGPVLMKDVVATLWPTGRDLYATGPTSAARSGYGLWRFPPHGEARPVAWIAQAPQGEAWGDLVRSTIKFEWTEEGPDDVVWSREIVLVFPPG